MEYSDFVKIPAQWCRRWTLGFRIQRAVRLWLGVGDILQAQDDFGRMQTARLGLVLEQQVKDQREIRALREAVQSMHSVQQTQLDQIQRGLGAMAAMQQRESTDVLNRETALLGAVVAVQGAVGALQETEDRIYLLLEPHAMKLRERAIPVKGWDEVQRENLRQFEESADGKSIRG